MGSPTKMYLCVQKQVGWGTWHSATIPVVNFPCKISKYDKSTKGESAVKRGERREAFSLWPPWESLASPCHQTLPASRIFLSKEGKRSLKLQYDWSAVRRLLGIRSIWLLQGGRRYLWFHGTYCYYAHLWDSRNRLMASSVSKALLWFSFICCGFA